jgi:hypothetical protein
MRKPARGISSVWVCTMTTSICGTPDTNRGGTPWLLTQGKILLDCGHKGTQTRTTFRGERSSLQQLDWFAPAHLSDTTGPMAGGSITTGRLDSSLTSHDYSDMPADFASTAKELGRLAPDRWKLQYFLRIKDAIDQHRADLLYTTSFASPSDQDIPQGDALILGRFESVLPSDNPLWPRNAVSKEYRYE